MFEHPCQIPTYVIYPLAIAKILGVAAIWYSRSGTLKTFAYAGFFFNILLAVSSHIINIGDGEFGVALLTMIFLITSLLTRNAHQALKPGTVE